MFRAASLFGILGLAAAIGLIAWQGYAPVMQAFAAAGWGIMLTSLFHAVPMALAVLGWRMLWPGKTRPSFGFMFLAMWVRAGVNNMLPVARIGGEVVAARLLIKHGWRRSPSIAGLVVETTVSVVTVFILVVSGILLFTLHDPNTHMMTRLVIGALVSLPVIILLGLLQRFGIFRFLARLAHWAVGARWQSFIHDTARLDRAVLTMYRRGGRVFGCGVWMLISWYLNAVEIWLGLYFLGHPLSAVDCIILEAMVQLVSSAAFVVPGALGAQEGAFLFFGGMLGLPSETALALALIRRCRDVIFYVPALIVWQVIEGKWLAAGRAAAKAA
jgi:putative membrane protein